MAGMDMAHFVMRKAHQRFAITQHAGADPGADGGIGQCASTLARTRQPFADRRAIDICVHHKRHAERIEHIVEPRALPARLWCGGEGAIGG